MPCWFESDAMRKYLVAQVGSRRGYAVADAFAKAGMLEALYTDLCADLDPGRLLWRLGRRAFPGASRKLSGRRIPEALLGKARSFSTAALLYELEKVFAGRNRHRQGRALSRFGSRLGRTMARAGFGDATHLYTFLGDVTPLLQAARDKGIVTVTEIYIVLSSALLELEEVRKHPGLEEAMPSDLLAEAFAWLGEVLRLSDWLVVPSQAVLDDLVRNFGVKADRCLLVPYAAGDMWFQVENEPQPGRILFVGSAGLRKGIHTLGEAAALLSRRDYAFRVAGGVSEGVRSHPITHGLTFLGRVPRVDVVEEYRAADVFVLPSIAEGSAEVTYEALAAGIPVVTTAEAGSVVRDGVEGFIVPALDAGALADRLEHIVEDRELRARMAAAARLRAGEFTWGKYGERLVNALTLASAVESPARDGVALPAIPQWLR